MLPGRLYLLDEPETSLSPQNQIRLAEQINELARYLDSQFIIASHSPFMLGTLNAKLYNLDAGVLQTNWRYRLNRESLCGTLDVNDIDNHKQCIYHTK
ncbi:AAA family ATPase [Paenibacillus oryzae]|uniref:AAA family ATPase n=1 Tax=Paenibacillus oryzae TaxID=1844972 RepID=UPI000B18B11E|nr:AAA family ATPase [Paenibacillus oryzae]